MQLPPYTVNGVCLLLIDILLIVYVFLPSAGPFVALSLLVLLLIIFVTRITRAYCREASGIQNLEPDLQSEPLIEAPTSAAGKVCWGRFNGCGVEHLKKESSMRKVLPEYGSSLMVSPSLAKCKTRVHPNMFPSLAKYKTRVHPSMFGLSTSVPFEYLAAEVTPGVHSDEALKWPQPRVFIEDDRDVPSGVEVVEVINGCENIEISVDSDLRGEATI